MRKIIFLFILLFTQIFVFAQQPLQLQLQQRGEVVVSFDASYLKQIPNVGTWSVDKVKGEKAYVYLNKKQYEKLLELNIPFVPEPVPSMLTEAKMATTIAGMNEWDAYPTYENYVAMMQEFANDFPELCKLDTIGYSIDERLLLAVKISDNVNQDETEPEFFYTSSMHGDEITGYVLMLRLIDYLLNNYTTVAQVKSLVDNLEIYINPLANPDGTYTDNNATVNGATRSNALGVDINRNFPDPIKGDHPDGNSWMPETYAMMQFMEKHHFNLSMNFHGGTEVLNYPWDNKSERHPDDSWFQLVCRQYADTVHTIAPNYLTDFANGITNGYDWYQVFGGRQDYVTHFLHGREITAELSTTKLVNASTLPTYWDRNYKSLLNYMEQATYGIHGTVKDDSGIPLEAKISVLEHDKDSSFVRTQTGGVFYRYLKAGTYALVVEANGFSSKTISNVQVNDFAKLDLNVILEKPSVVVLEKKPEISIYPNPANDNFTVTALDQALNNIQLLTPDGKLVKNILVQGQASAQVDISELRPGLYFVLLHTGQSTRLYKLIVD